MNTPSIKIIKRRTATAAATDTELKVSDGSVKDSRLVRREIVKTIAGWIDERREQSRLAEIIARQMISGKPLTSKG